MAINRLEKLALVRKVTAYKQHACQRAPDEVTAALWADREFVKMAVRKEAGLLKHAAEALRDDREVCLLAVKATRSDGPLRHCSARLRDDRDLVLACVERDASDFQYASERLRSDREIALTATKTYDSPASHVAAELLDDPAFALQMVNLNGDTLKNLPERLRATEDIVMAAVDNGQSAYRNASARLRADPDVVMAACISSGNLEVWLGIKDKHADMPAALFGHREVVLHLLATDIMEPAQVAKSLHADHAVQLAMLRRKDEEGRARLPKSLASDAGAAVIAAFGTDGFQWPAASDALWADRDFVRVAAACDFDAAVVRASDKLLQDAGFFITLVRSARRIGVVPECWRADPAVAEAAVCRSGRGDNLAAFSEAVRGDRDFILHCLRRGRGVLKHATDALRGDRDLVRTAIFVEPDQLKHASAPLRADKALALLALNTRSGACHSPRGLFKTLSPELRADREVVLAALECEGIAIEHAAEGLRNDLDIVLAAVAADYGALNNVDPVFRSDAEVIYTMLACGGFRGIQDAGEEFRADREVMMDCVANTPSTFQYATDDLKNDIAYLTELKALSLRVFEWVPLAIASQVLATRLQTSNYRGRRIVCEVLPSEYARDGAHSVQAVKVVQGSRVLASADVMAVAEFAEHGPVGSYLCHSASNSLALIGDFVFYVSERGLDGERTAESGLGWLGVKGTGPATVDRQHEVWLVDLPSEEVKLDLSRAHLLDIEGCAAAGLHPISKGPEPIPGLLLYHGDAQRYYEAVCEVAKGADASVFSDFGHFDGRTFQTRAPVAISACGGAARVHVDGLGHRWLFPSEDGYYVWAELKAVLDRTSHSDDWRTLRDVCLADATEAECALVVEHFSDTGDRRLAAKVRKHVQRSNGPKT